MPSPYYFHAYSRDGIGNGKDKHFAALQSTTGIAFKHMLFFDDMKDNIDAAAKQGTTSVQLNNRAGLTVEAFACGIEGWRKANVISGV
jgi:methionine salvage enolase-phosphatase E1